MAPFVERLDIDVNAQQSSLSHRVGLVCLVFVSSLALGLAPIVFAANFPESVPDNIAGTNPHTVLNQ